MYSTSVRGRTASAVLADLRARAVQYPSRLQADAGVAARDDRDLAGQVDALDHLLGGGRGAEAGIQGLLCGGHALSLPHQLELLRSP
jgi:hypothetical protein